MKNLISKFSDKLLSNQQLRTVKGGNYYCLCASGGGGAPVATQDAAACASLCFNGPGSTGWITVNCGGNGWGGGHLPC